MSKENIIDKDRILGFESSSDKISDEEYKLIKEKIDSFLETQSPKQKIENRILALKYKMEDYIEQKEPEKILFVGGLIRELLDIINIKDKTFAEYIGFSKYDFSKLLNGKRKINGDLAIKLGQIFKIKPNLWIEIEIKNELFFLEKEKKNEYKKYSLDDLIKI
ncbi:MAG: addiction module antidote protein, HigA family [Candidatus Sericytochromatia bacterium]